MTREEFSSSVAVLPLSDLFDLNEFDCGDEDLNDFLHNESRLYEDALIAATYLVVSLSTRKVLAYFSLANDKISLSDFESKTEFNRFRKQKFVNEKRLRSYPALKIGRLAIDKSMRNQSIGTYLLEYVSSMMVDERKSGCRFVTVDAYVDAIPFYIKNDYQFLNNDDEDKNTRVMYFDLVSLL